LFVGQGWAGLVLVAGGGFGELEVEVLEPVAALGGRLELRVLVET
jgi:hypothetical protein